VIAHCHTQGSQNQSSAQLRVALEFLYQNIIVIKQKKHEQKTFTNDYACSVVIQVYSNIYACSITHSAHYTDLSEFESTVNRHLDSAYCPGL